MQGSIRQARLSVFVVAILACLVMGAIAESAQAGGVTVSLDASKKRLKPNGRTDLSGRLSGVFSGNDGKTVTLLATPFPYSSEQVAGTTTTDAEGDFAFPNVEPELNTRYRVTFDGDVLDGDGASEPVQIYVFPRFDVEIEATSRPGAVQGNFDGFYSPAVQPEFLVGNRVFWYFRKTTQDTFKRVESSKFRDTIEGVHAQATIRLPRSRKGYRYFIGACSEVPNEDIGIGPPEKVNCPKRFSVRTGAVRMDPRTDPSLHVASR